MDTLVAEKQFLRQSRTKEVLFECSTLQETYKIEGELVTEDLLKDPKCYNIKLGGKIPPDQTGRKMPPRTKETLAKHRQAKLGKNNPRHIGIWITPWGKYFSLDDASNACPSKMTGNAIGNACRKNNNKVISNLSIARSKGFLKSEHVGSTYKELGFGLNMKSGRKK